MKLMGVSLTVVLFTPCWDRPCPLPSLPTPTRSSSAQDIVIARCLGPVPDGGPYDDGLYPVEV
jgi:hypothetical protein